MPINIKADGDLNYGQNFIDLTTVGDDELKKIETHAKLVLLALEAIAEINCQVIIKAARDLHVKSKVGERIASWRLQSSHLQPDSIERTKLNIEEARSLVIIICHLANLNQELLRRGVSLLEQCEPKQPPHQTTLLGNYLGRFSDYYRTRIDDSRDISTEFLSDLAWKLLSDLLFYSGHNGCRLLWLALFDAARISTTS